MKQLFKVSLLKESHSLELEPKMTINNFHEQIH